MRLPGQLISQLMAAIRDMFCREWPDKQWGQWFGFIRREVVTWPAAFMAKKGFALSSERYAKVMLDLLKDIRVHGDTGRVNFIPGYLQKCVQNHFPLHWEEYYAEAKSARALTDRAILGLAKAPAAANSERHVETLAEIHKALKAGGTKSRRKTPMDQLPLF